MIAITIQHVGILYIYLTNKINKANEKGSNLTAQWYDACCLFLHAIFLQLCKMMPQVSWLPAQAISNCLTHFFKPICALILLLGFAINCSGQATDYKVHANIIYRFTKYIEWPENKPGDFVIGIIGDSPLYEELGALTANKSVGDQRIVVKKLSASAAFYSCQILFIGQDESRNLKRIALLTADQPVLLITEENGLAKKGSCINFIIVDDRLKLEINKNNVLSRNLNIASELLKLATIVANDNAIANSPKL
jgi:hypothetical protein